MNNRTEINMNVVYHQTNQTSEHHLIPSDQVQFRRNVSCRDPCLSASEASFSQWGAIQIQLPFPFLFCHTASISARNKKNVNCRVIQMYTLSLFA